MNYKIAQLALTPGRKSTYTTEIFVSQPDSSNEEAVGILFAIFEAMQNSSAYAQLIDFIIKNISQNYYQNEKILIKDKFNPIKVEHVFETALAKTNKAIHEYCQDHDLDIDSDQINATLGIIHASGLHFSIIGKNKALLIHKDSDKNKRAQTNQIRNSNHEEEKTIYKVTDLTRRTADEDTEGPQLEKLFPGIVSGSVPVGGYIVFSNEALPEYLSSKQLIDIITTLPPISAVEQIKNSLSAINSFVPFLGIIIKNITGLPPSMSVNIKKNLHTVTAQESIINLNSTEEKTERYLSPPGFIRWQSMQKFWMNVSSFFTSQNKSNNKLFLFKDKIFFKQRPSFISTQKIYGLLGHIKNAIIYFLTIILYIFKIATNRQELSKIIARLTGFFSGLWSAIRSIFGWFGGLSLKYKAMIGIIIISIGLFSANLYITNHKNKKIELSQVSHDIAKIIEQKQNKIEADLLYNNKEDARKTFNEVEAMIGQLPEATQEEKTSREKFYKKFNEQMGRIRQIVNIDKPAEIANLSKLESNAQPINLALSADAKKLYAGDAANKTFYILDTADNSVTNIRSDASTSPISFLKFPSSSINDKDVFFLEAKQVIGIDTSSDKIRTVPFVQPLDLDNTAAAAGYNNKIYAANKKDNKIYLYSKKADGFHFGLSWLSDPTDLSKVVSMDIDGQVYLLDNNGQIRKFLKGKKQEFKQEPAEPAFKNPVKILVSPTGKYIYVFEPSSKRIVVYNKTGVFIMQYQFNSLDNPKDFSVNEKTKTIYVLSGTSIYSAPGSHFDK